jgi:glutamate 5-kinase
MYIASGSNPEILYDILDGKEVGTLFKASKWILL